MTHCDWITRTIGHDGNVPVPYNFMFSPPAQQLVEDHFGTDLQSALALPMRMAGCKSIKPLYAHPSQYGETITDEFGVTWSTSEIDRGQPTGPCLLEPFLAQYRFPDPAAAYRFEDLAAWCDDHRDGFRVVWVGDLWERATFMRGMVELLMDLALHPAFVEELLSRIGAHIELLLGLIGAIAGKSLSRASTTIIIEISSTDDAASSCATS